MSLRCTASCVQIHLFQKRNGHPLMLETEWEGERRKFGRSTKQSGYTVDTLQLLQLQCSSNLTSFTLCLFFFFLDTEPKKLPTVHKCLKTKRYIHLISMFYQLKRKINEKILLRKHILTFSSPKVFMMVYKSCSNHMMLKLFCISSWQGCYLYSQR